MKQQLGVQESLRPSLRAWVQSPGATRCKELIPSSCPLTSTRVSPNSPHTTVIKKEVRTPDLKPSAKKYFPFYFFFLSSSFLFSTPTSVFSLPHSLLIYNPSVFILSNLYVHRNFYKTYFEIFFLGLGVVQDSCNPSILERWGRRIRSSRSE